MAEERGDPKHEGSEDVFTTANRIATSIPEASSREEKLDGILDRMEDAASAVKSWYEDNEQIVKAAAEGITSLSSDASENAISGFKEASKVILDGLDGLAELHPFVAVAVIAFKLVITLDVTRRANNKKVIALKITIQEMMVVLFQLKDVRDPERPGPDGKTIRDRISPLIRKIAKDIQEAGSLCDHYMKKSFLAKTLKSMIYDSRLAEQAELFVEHRDELRHRLTVHITLSIDAAHEKLDSHSSALHEVHEKLDMLIIFQKLSTRREREIQQFVEAHGNNAKACLDNDQLLTELLEKSGEDIDDIIGREQDTKVSNPLSLVKRVLTKELSEDVDVALQKNFSIFEKKLRLQHSRLEQGVKQALREQRRNILQEIKSGAHDLILDQDLREVWRLMGWRGSVKGVHFVLAVQDHFISANVVSPAGGVEKGSEWALNYINVGHVQPILEAIDYDGTGYVSISEANRFTNAKPEGWSLLYWLAFWSEGWQLTIDRYKHKIYRLLQMLHESVDRVLSLNRHIADVYLSDWTFEELDRILRATAPARTDSKLASFIQEFTQREEDRLRDNLEGFNYEIDDLSTLRLITGPGRTERFLFPVLYLLLRRHVAIMRQAELHVLDDEEFLSMQYSIANVLEMLDSRMDDLVAAFGQTRKAPQEELDRFSHGIFRLLYNTDNEWDRAANSLGNWFCDDASIISEVEEAVQQQLALDSTEVLKYPVKDTLQSDVFEPRPIPEVQAVVQDSISGTWTGYLYKDVATDLQGLTQFDLKVDRDGNIRGTAENYTAVIDVSGSISPRNDVYFHLKYRPPTSVYFPEPTTCTGEFEPSSKSITGLFYVGDGGTQVSEVGGVTVFVLTRTPASLQAYRYTPEQLQENAARCHWHFACNAVLHDLRKSRWSSSYFSQLWRCHRRFLELSTRVHEDSQHYTPFQPLSETEWDELQELRRSIPPSIARFLASQVPDEFRRITIHENDCDNCGRIITRDRFICTRCIDDKFDEAVDLCLMCTESTPFNHDLSHPLVKVRNIIHDAELAWVIPDARDISVRIKQIFRNDPGNVSEAFSCCRCSTVISLPCWVCAECVADTFICDACESQKDFTRTMEHDWQHALVRIFNADVTKGEPNTETRLIELERKLAMFDERFSSLESSVQQILSVLSSSTEG